MLHHPAVTISMWWQIYRTVRFILSGNAIYVSSRAVLLYSVNFESGWHSYKPLDCVFLKRRPLPLHLLSDIKMALILILIKFTSFFGLPLHQSPHQVATDVGLGYTRLILTQNFLRSSSPWNHVTSWRQEILFHGLTSFRTGLWFLLRYYWKQRSIGSMIRAIEKSLDQFLAWNSTDLLPIWLNKVVLVTKL